MVNKWFTDQERALATAILVVGGPIGVGVSYGMTGYWFIDVTEETGNEEFMAMFQSLMIAQLVVAAIFWLVFNLSIKEKPDKPPSAVAEV